MVVEALYMTIAWSGANFGSDGKYGAPMRMVCILGEYEIIFIG